MSLSVLEGGDEFLRFFGGGGNEVLEVAIVVDAVGFLDLFDLDALGVEAFLLEFLLVDLLLLLRLLGILLPQPVNHLHLNDKSPKIINHQPLRISPPATTTPRTA